MEPNYGEMLRKQFSEPSPERLQAIEEYPVGSWVYLKVSGQVGKVAGHFDSQDGVLIKVEDMGTVPVGELRKATEEEIPKQRRVRLLDKYLIFILNYLQYVTFKKGGFYEWFFDSDEDELDSDGGVSNEFSREDHLNAERCAPWAHTNMGYTDRLRAAQMFGENWANIISGLGDQ